VSINASAVIKKEREILVERAQGIDQEGNDYSGRLIVAHDSASAVVSFGTLSNIEKGIFLGGNGSSNYYHFLIEILSRLQYLASLGEEFDDYPLLISEDVSVIPAFGFLLRLFADARDTIRLSRSGHYHVGELLYITSPNTMPFNLKAGWKIRCRHTVLNPRSIGFLREMVLSHVLRPNGPISSDSGFKNGQYPEKIYLRRTSDLRKFNQEEVFSVLKDRGFQAVDMEQLSFEQQVRIVHNAKMIVGPTGAAWTNLLFSRRGSRALCWMPDEAAEFSAYSTLARYIGVDLRYLTYKTGLSSTMDFYSADYYLSPISVENALVSI
jgi:hypothetical protein